MNINTYIKDFYKNFPFLKEYKFPWEITNKLEEIILKLIKNLPKDEFEIKDNIAIHKSAKIENFTTLKDPIIINKNCQISAGAYIRNSVFLDENVHIGPNCEIKQSIILKNTHIAHLNYVGNSIIGQNINMEAGSILANHFNERENKEITVKIENSQIKTGSKKFGSLLGDKTKIGANSVLNPGTILPQNSIVPRLTHINQLKD